MIIEIAAQSLLMTKATTTNDQTEREALTSRALITGSRDGSERTSKISRI